MSVKATTWVWEHSQSSGNARLVLLAIADAADQEGANAWPSQNTIAAMCRLSVRTVRRIVADLVDLGELEVVEHGGQAYRDDRRPHRYRLCGMPGRTGGQNDRPSPPRPPTGGQPRTDGRTNRAPRADTVVRQTSLLDPPLKNPSGGTADAVAADDQEDSMPKSPDHSQGALFDPPAPDPAVVEDKKPGRAEGPQTVVAAFAESHRDFHGTAPLRSETGRVGRAAAGLLAAGHSLPDLVEAAANMGRTAFCNLEVQVKRLRKGTGSQGFGFALPNGHESWERGSDQTEEEAARLLRENPELAAFLHGAA